MGDSRHAKGPSKPRRKRISKSAETGARALAVGAAAVGAAFASTPADAANFTVSNLNDAGAGSLRQAIDDSNTTAGSDIVQFQAGLTGTITLTTGQLDITDSVDIQGPGAAVLTVSGNNASRVFYLYESSVTLDVKISGLTITGGNANIGGGLVDFDENLTLDHVVITGNSTSGDGGGLWADGFNMNLHIYDSTLSGNSAGDDGGAIYVEDTGGPLIIKNSVVSGNTAVDKGGGIYFYDPDDDLTIDHTTVAGNTAGTIGGGIYLYSPDSGNWTLSADTISGNSALAGGGLFFYSPDHPLTIVDTTISGNHATAGDGGGVYFYNFYSNQVAIEQSTIANNTATGSGGGAFMAYSTPLILDGSIVADNTAPTNPDLSNGKGGGFDARFTLVEAPGTASITDSGGNVFNQDPQLGALGNHGGLTQTQVPAYGGPAVNAGDAAFAPPPAQDQRDLARVVAGRIDMGAVEVNPGTIGLAVSSASFNENVGTATITVTRTGGSDGAVSVTVNTANGSAVAPGDFAAIVGGTVSFADGDSASKTINVTIVNDATDEPDEDFFVVISAPTGGAALGAIVTEDVTIVDDDLPLSVVAVPTLDEWGLIVLGAVLGGASIVMMRRRRGTAAMALALAATAAAAGPVDAAPAHLHRKQPATVSPSHTVARLADGSTVDLRSVEIEVKDHRTPKERHALKALPKGIAALDSGFPTRVYVRPGGNGKAPRLVIMVGSAKEDKVGH